MVRNKRDRDANIHSTIRAPTVSAVITVISVIFIAFRYTVTSAMMTHSGDLIETMSNTADKENNAVTFTLFVFSVALAAMLTPIVIRLIVRKPYHNDLIKKTHNLLKKTSYKILMAFVGVLLILYVVYMNNLFINTLFLIVILLIVIYIATPMMTTAAIFCCIYTVSILGFGVGSVYFLNLSKKRDLNRDKYYMIYHETKYEDIINPLCVSYKDYNRSSQLFRINIDNETFYIPLGAIKLYKEVPSCVE